jgi:glycosyltransferase involved in cell wall biosynthesis
VIRVLHVITRLTLGGSSENTIGQMAALARAGYDCTLAAGLAESEAATVQEARRRGCRLVDVPSLGREVAPVRDVRALLGVIGFIRKTRPVIVHTHTSKAGFVGRFAARLTRVPAVIHQPHGHIFYGYYGRGRSEFYIGLERIAARWTDRIVTLTDRGTEEHLAQRIGRREQYVAVPSGVPIGELQANAPGPAQARAQLGLAPRDFVVVGLGRLVPVKGFDVLVRALGQVVAEVPSTIVLLVGDGPERLALEGLAGALGVRARIRVEGATTAPSAVATYLAAADVCAAPSRNEGMGRALVEAMALGVPVVGAAVGGIPSVIGVNECGRLIAPDDVGALAAALIELGRDPRLRAKLGEAARIRAAEFSVPVAEARLVALYAALCEAKRLR